MERAITVEKRVEDAKNKIIKALTAVDRAIELFIKKNADLSIAKCELEKYCENLKSELKNLQAEKEQLIRRGRVDLGAQSNVTFSNPSFSNDEDLFPHSPDERLTDQNASEYIDISINQLKSLLKRKNKR